MVDRLLRSVIARVFGPHTAYSELAIESVNHTIDIVMLTTWKDKPMVGDGTAFELRRAA